MAPVPAFGQPSDDYDPNCVPQRYQPCLSQIVDERIGAAHSGLSPNAVVVLIFFLTIGLWVGFYFFFMWWIGRDIDKIKEAIEEERLGGTRVRLEKRVKGGSDVVISGVGVTKGKGKGKMGRNGG